MIFWDGSRGFRCAPTPGYLLQPLWGKELDLFLKDHMKTLKNLVYGVISSQAKILRYFHFTFVILH
jgi:hypothetical protein